MSFNLKHETETLGLILHSSISAHYNILTSWNYNCDKVIHKYIHRMCNVCHMKTPWAGKVRLCQPPRPRPLQFQRTTNFISEFVAQQMFDAFPTKIFAFIFADQTRKLLWKLRLVLGWTLGVFYVSVAVPSFPNGNNGIYGITECAEREELSWKGKN